MTIVNRKPAKKDYDLLMANGCEYRNGKEWGYHYKGQLDGSTELHLIGRNAVEASDYLRSKGAIDVSQVKAAVEKNRKEIVAEMPKSVKQIKKVAKKVAKKGAKKSGRKAKKS
jgi:hypothetical protein